MANKCFQVSYEEVSVALFLEQYFENIYDVITVFQLADSDC